MSQASAPSDFRIRRRAEYEKVYAEGRRLHGRFMILFFVPRSGPPTRFGLAVSRKVGGATVRNLVKRRMREICRRNLLSVDAQPADFVLSLRREAATARFQELENEAVRLAAKARGPR